jgi:hypothetical protein
MQPAALDERVADQAEIVVLEVAQSAVDQLAGRRRRAAGPVVLLDQRDRVAAQRGVIGDPCAVDPAADDQDVEGALLQGSGRAQQGEGGYL